MNRQSTLLSALLACSLYAIANTVVLAHGEKKHDDAMETFDPITTEFGQYEPDLEPTQTVAISMADTMRFSPSELTVKTGDIVKFVVANDGELMHEFVLGTADSLAEHAEMMLKHPNMEHDEAYMAHVEPGKEMEIIWQFTETGTFEFGCLLPGHFQAGMKGTITVE